MAALQEFILYIDGKDLKSLTQQDLYYDEIIEMKLFAPLGLAPVSSFKMTEYTNVDLVYDVTADTVFYPTIEDYAKKFEESLKQFITDRTIKYNITKDKDGKDVITFNLDYSYKTSNFEKDFQEAKKQYNEEQYLIGLYNNAIRLGDEKAAAELKKKIDELQKIQVTPITSASESELQKKALEVEEKEQPEKAPPSTPEKQSPLPQSKPPVIVTPTEKTTISSTKESAKEKTFIESTASKLFDTKILGYEKSLIDRGLVSVPSETKITEASKLSMAPEKSISESKLLTEKESSEGLTLEKLLSGIYPTMQSMVPTDVSTVASSLLSKDASSYVSTILGKEVTDAFSSQIKQTSSIISSISETVKLVQDSVASTSSMLRDNMLKMDSMINDVARESTSAVGLISSASNDASNKIAETVISSEKSASESTILSEIQNKIVDIETKSPLRMEISTMVTNLGDTIKNAVTSISKSDKMDITKVSPSPAPPPPATTSISNVDQGETMTNIGTQTNQNLFGGGSAFPTVVSLSQSTIDNLASAIIKNMSITPFLNSGR